MEGGVRDVAQLVARTAGGREAAGSSPVIPTKLSTKRANDRPELNLNDELKWISS